MPRLGCQPLLPAQRASRPCHPPPHEPRDLAPPALGTGAATVPTNALALSPRHAPPPVNPSHYLQPLPPTPPIRIVLNTPGACWPCTSIVAALWRFGTKVPCLDWGASPCYLRNEPATVPPLGRSNRAHQRAHTQPPTPPPPPVTPVTIYSPSLPLRPLECFQTNYSAYSSVYPLE